MRRVPLTARIVLGFVAGVALGAALGKDAARLGDLGKAVIGLVKALAGPFLFFTILRSVLETPLTGRQARLLAAVTSVNALFAIAIGVGISTIFEPGRALTSLAQDAAGAGAGTAWKPASWSFDAWVKSLAPRSVLEPVTENAVLSLAVGALVTGLAARAALRAMAGEERARAETLARTAAALGHGVFERLLSWSVQLAPAAVLAVVAASVGEKGLGALAGLWAYLAAGAAGLALQVLVVYQAWIAWAGIPLRTFWAFARKPAVYSAGANSSLATLPLTMEALEGLRVSKPAATLGACIGTNLNNDGILLYEAMAVLFVAQAHGLHLTLGTKVATVAFCWLATVGIGGVPEAGFVSLSVILGQVGLPQELLPFLLGVDWLLARLRSVVNVAADMTTSIVLDRWMRAPPGAATGVAEGR